MMPRAPPRTQAAMPRCATYCLSSLVFLCVCAFKLPWGIVVIGAMSVLVALEMPQWHTLTHTIIVVQGNVKDAARDAKGGVDKAADKAKDALS